MGELNLFDLNKFNTDVFVETGTGIGTGLSHAVKFPFKKLYSIEIMEDLLKKNIEKFKQDNVTLVLNNSIDGLQYILNQIGKEERILFWLDAHFPGVDFQLKPYDNKLDNSINIPLKNELDIILSLRPNNKDTFIIDDLRLYEDGNYELGNIPDREKYNCGDIKFITKLFTNTHTITKDYRHQGFLIIEPKK